MKLTQKDFEFKGNVLFLSPKAFIFLFSKSKSKAKTISGKKAAVRSYLHKLLQPVAPGSIKYLPK